LLGRGPIACRIGRMIVAMRANHAGAVSVRIATDIPGTPA
jgi:ferrous iron transport protein A